jgi:subtilisin family serine protease
MLVMMIKLRQVTSSGRRTNKLFFAVFCAIAIAVSQGLGFDVVEGVTLRDSDDNAGGSHARSARTQEPPEQVATGPTQIPFDKFTRDARATFAANDYPNIYWLFVDSTAIADQPIPLTVRAHLRRAKADPAGLLRDNHDYPISEAALQHIRNLGVTVRHASRYLKAVAVIADSAQIAQAATLPFVRKVHTLRTLEAPMPEVVRFDQGEHPKSAIDFGYGQSLRQNQIIQADRLHLMGITGSGVMIAIFDTGFDTDHPVLSGASIIARYDFINQDTSVSENECTVSGAQNYHGTLVFGVIGATAPDTMIGVAPDADFILAKTEIVCDGTEIKLEEDNWIAAAEWADSIGADVITSSLSYTQFTDSGSYTLDDMDGNTALITIAADIAASKNIIVITSAGNSRQSLTWSLIGAPADGDSVLAIGAVRSDSTLTTFSSPGPTADGRIKPDVTTMGKNVYTIGPKPVRDFKYASGTSLSAPLVAGGAALALQYDPTMTAEQFRQLARSTASQADSPDNDFGYGLFNAFRSSGIATLEDIDTIRVTVGEVREVPFAVSGNSGSMPLLSLREPPAGVVLQDFGDGSGILSVTGSSENPPQISFRLIADFDQYSDSATIYLETFVPADRQIFAGPNPFADSVRIFVDPVAGSLKSVSIFNISGEKIWEKVNLHPESTDSIREWTMLAWNGRNQQGQPASAGVYLAVVRTDRHQVVLKLLKSN